ncbi:branched-chain amino acid ABC transporter permease, partial [Mesorhizobium sp. M00.F.Ca.ET.186.01.1.1]
MNGYQKKLPVVLLLLVAAILPFLANNYWLDVATLALFYIVLAQGLNVVLGFPGL